MTRINQAISMLNKTFILMQFGTPHVWMREHFDNISRLGQYGWNWMIFTSNVYENVPSNMKIVPMTTDEFNNLTEKRLGVRPNMFMTEKGVPSVHATDFYVFGGEIFNDYLKDVDYWGIANVDMVFGRLDKFLPDSELEKYNIWTDDPTSFNGIFSLMRNNPIVNKLYLLIPDWQKKISQSPCPKCTTGEGNHTLFGTDEYDMSDIIKLGHIKVGKPEYHPLHSHDRLEQHVPQVKLELKDDGSLYELFKDINGPNWIHAHPYIGHEIMYFHFLRTKEWPKCLRK